jgi:hypothetical protein
MGRLKRNQGQFFYSFCLDEVVPDDHPVREIAGVLDLSWVYAELACYYMRASSRAASPRRSTPPRCGPGADHRQTWPGQPLGGRGAWEQHGKQRRRCMPSRRHRPPPVERDRSAPDRRRSRSDGRLVSLGILPTFRTAMEVADHGLDTTRGRCGGREPRQRMLSELLPPGRKTVRVQVPAWMCRRASLALQDVRGQLEHAFSSVAGVAVRRISFFDGRYQ